jgi:hypothetical protein
MPSSNQFTVKVGDNFHMYDSDDIYTKGVYASYDLAVVVAKQVVVESLLHLLKQKPGMSCTELYQAYTSGGEDPFIVGARPGDPWFSAWSYAKSVASGFANRR